MKRIITIPSTFGQLKNRHPEAILLFCHDDYYACYQSDAIEVRDVLKEREIQFVEHPFEYVENSDHTKRILFFRRQELDNYLPAIIRAGKRVAICNQIK